MLCFWSGSVVPREVRGPQGGKGSKKASLSCSLGRAKGELSAGGEGGGMVMAAGHRAGWAKRTGSQCPRSQLLAQAQSDSGETDGVDT